MLVRSVDDVTGTEDDIQTENWRSARIILAREQVGFPVHQTALTAGPDTDSWYANHSEAVFSTEGEGQIIDLATDEVHALKPGTVYLLNNHDKHRVPPRTQIKCVCVFNPPVTGREVHD